MYTENHKQSVLQLKPFSKAKHCWVCTIILRDAGHSKATVFNRRYKNTNCCERCVQTGGQARMEAWMKEQVIEEFENQDLPADNIDATVKKILDGIKFY